MQATSHLHPPNSHPSSTIRVLSVPDSRRRIEAPFDFRSLRTDGQLNYLGTDAREAPGVSYLELRFEIVRNEARDSRFKGNRIHQASLPRPEYSIICLFKRNPNFPRPCSTSNTASCILFRGRDKSEKNNGLVKNLLQISNNRFARWRLSSQQGRLYRLLNERLLDLKISSFRAIFTKNTFFFLFFFFKPENVEDTREEKETIFKVDRVSPWWELRHGE